MKWLLLLMICMYAASCTEQCTGKQVTCPAFDDKTGLQWIPYFQNQQLIFSSAAGIDSFNINQVNSSSSYPETVTATKPYCSAQASFISGESLFYTGKGNLINISLTVQHDEFANTTNKSAAVYVKQTPFNSGGFSDTGLLNSNNATASHFYASHVINNKTFANVQEIYTDTLQRVFSQGEVYKIWIAKNVGIAAYEEYHGNLWVKQ